MKVFVMRTGRRALFLHLFLVLVCLLASGGMWRCEASATGAGGPSLFYSAQEDWNSQRWESALGKYRAIASVPSPYTAKAHIQLGKYYKYHGRWNEALKEFEDAIAEARVTRDAEDAATSIGAVYLSKGDYGTALAIFREIMAKTEDWQQVKYSAYWIKELKRRMSFGEDAGCGTCGVSALEELLRSKNISLSRTEHNRLVSSSPRGMSFDDVVKLARSRGLNALGVKLSLDQLRKGEKPVIALIENPRHYVVVKSMDADGVGIVDPEYSRDQYLMPEKEFRKVWSGFAIVVSGPGTGRDLALLSGSEMQSLRGRVCYCCPESDNGTQVPNTHYDKKCVNPVLSVNTVNLNLVVEETDFAYSGLGPGVHLTRVYNSDDSRDGPLGHSWTFNYNMSLAENPGGSVDIRRETGTIQRFNASGGGSYTAPQGVYDKLVKNGDGTYSLQLKGSKMVYGFSSSGVLTALTDRNGNALTLQYNTDKKLASVTDAAGRASLFAYGSNGKISSVTDPMGRTVRYAYDGKNNLTSTTDMAGRTVSFIYNTNSYMTDITTSRGTTSMTYTGSNEGYALATITDPMGNTRTYGTSGSHYNVKITDENGNSTYYMNTSSGYNATITDALGNVVTFGYDSSGNRTSIKDAKGNTTSLTYDGKGNVTQYADPLGNNIQLSYDDGDNLIKLIDPRGNPYLYEYDAASNLKKTTDPEGGVTAFTYDARGQLTGLSDARSNSTAFTYDAKGNPVNVQNAGGSDVYTYDGIGRVVSRKVPSGVVTAYAYDGINRLTKVTYPNGSAKTYTYDCCNLTAVSDKSGTVSFGYDPANRLTALKDVYGNIITYQRDPAGRLASLVYPDGKAVAYDYDPANRLVSVTDWLGNVTRYEYDVTGNLVAATYPDRSTVLQDYDGANRLKSMLDFKGDATVNAAFDYALDQSGNRKAVSFYQPLNAVPSIQKVSYSYDADNRLLTAGTTQFQYDNEGNLKTRTSGSTVSTYSWNYDAIITRIVNGSSYTAYYTHDGVGSRVSAKTNGVETRYVVDPTAALSSVLAETNASGAVSAYYIYGLGLISRITPTGQAYYYHYDGSGNTLAMTDSSGKTVNAYAYSVFGETIGQSETIPNPFKYVGKFGVIDDRNGLLYMRARYYDPTVGRFVSKDPKGLAGGMNAYGYTQNNPIRFVDPGGLDLTDVVLSCGGLALAVCGAEYLALGVGVVAAARSVADLMERFAESAKADLDGKSGCHPYGGLVNPGVRTGLGGLSLLESIYTIASNGIVHSATLGVVSCAAELLNFAAERRSAQAE